MPDIHSTTSSSNVHSFDRFVCFLECGRELGGKAILSADARRKLEATDIGCYLRLRLRVSLNELCKSLVIFAVLTENLFGLRRYSLERRNYFQS
jgi:hypothetical protein